MTVQAPQVPRSQTFLAPVWSGWLGRASSRGTLGSTVRWTGLPLILRVMGTGPGPTTLVAAGAAWASLSRRPDPRAPVPMPMPPRNPRRETAFLGLGSFVELTRHLPLVRARSEEHTSELQSLR